MIKKIKKLRIFNYLLKNLLYVIARLLIMSYRLRITYDDGVCLPILKNEGIFYFWHQQIIVGMTFFFKKKATGHCIVSPSLDGQVAGFICKKLGFSVLYGSSHKASVQVVRQALHVLNEHKQLCVVGDGSRGPAFELQAGLSFLASKTGVPLVFIECSSDWHITFSKSWDKFQIPLPFSKIYVRVHTPKQI